MKNKNDMNKFTYDYQETLKQKKLQDLLDDEPETTLDGLKHLNNNLLIALAEIAVNVNAIQQEQEQTNEALLELLEEQNKTLDLLAENGGNSHGWNKKYKFKR